jgi:hypothetical protein
MGPGRKGPRRQPLGAETGETGSCLPLQAKRLSFQPPTGVVSSGLYTVLLALCKACERDQGNAPGFCGTALDVHSTGILSFTE